MTRQGLMLTEEFAVAVVAAPANKFAPFHSIVDYPSYKKKFRQIELGRVGRPSSWIESSPASSPTQIKASAAAAAAAAASTAYRGGGDYERWLELHPSALGNFEELMVASKGKQIVMFLDYDGTLSPIVDDPDCAFMSDEMREAVRDVASHFPTAIVSGRCREKVSNFVRLSELYYAGSHGMDIKGPIHGHKHTKAKAKSVLFQPANEFLPMIDEVYKNLVETTKGVPGSRVENNKFCLSVHFRCVEEKKWNLLSDKVRSLLKGYPKLRITHGRKVMEIRPTIKWDKGKALEFLLESLGLSNRNDVLPLYVGDDRTDEDAFKVLRDRGQGFGILVSKIAKETNAAFSLREPAEVQTFLRRLAELPRGWCIGKVV